MLYYVAFWNPRGVYPLYSVRVSAESEKDAEAAALRGFKLACIGDWQTMENAIKRVEVRELSSASTLPTRE